MFLGTPSRTKVVFLFESSINFPSLISMKSLPLWLIRNGTLLLYLVSLDYGKVPSRSLIVLKMDGSSTDSCSDRFETRIEETLFAVGVLSYGIAYATKVSRAELLAGLLPGL